MSLASAQQKVLWGLSGGRCACCKAELIAETNVGKAIPLAEQAHIAARSPGGPRGEAALNPAERETAANYILLCPGCHALVDKDVNSWPIERLLKLKQEHEEWVRGHGVDVQMSEVGGRIEVVARDVDVVEGVVIEAPTRIKNGTRISVQAENARQVTGMRIQGPEK